MSAPERPKRPCGKPGRSGPPGNQNARKHGLHSLKHAVSRLGRRTIDRRTTVGRALAAWRDDLIEDLGGVERVSARQLALIDAAARPKLILDSLDAWLLLQPSLVSGRGRAAGVLPVLGDRNTLVTQLRSLLADIRRRGAGRNLDGETPRPLHQRLKRGVRISAERLARDHEGRWGDVERKRRGERPGERIGGKTAAGLPIAASLPVEVLERVRAEFLGDCDRGAAAERRQAARLLGIPDDDESPENGSS